MNKRLDPKTTPKGWKKVSYVCGIISGFGGYALINVEFPDSWRPYIVGIVSFSTALAGYAHTRVKK